LGRLTRAPARFLDKDGHSLRKPAICALLPADVHDVLLARHDAGHADLLWQAAVLPPLDSYRRPAAKLDDTTKLVPDGGQPCHTGSIAMYVIFHAGSCRRTAGTAVACKL